MTSHLLQLGIYDDGDVEPTFVIMLIDSPVVTSAQVEELLAVGVMQYGRTPPPHALFWDCHPGEEGDD